MDMCQIERIVKEELLEAELRILQRLGDMPQASTQMPANLLKPLPENENYAKALTSYLDGGTHSATAKLLGVSMAQTKKYYTWLVKNGHLPIENAELSAVEAKVVDCIFNREMSLSETAKELNCSISNVSYRRDSALRKGYNPNQ